MINEYALEPELVASWTDRRDFRHFVGCFGLGHGRIVSRYPKHWVRLVWEAFDRPGEIERKRLEELLIRLSERMVRRTKVIWDPTTKNWLENAEQEHRRRPFHGILARSNPRGHPAVVSEADLDSGTEPRWAADHGCTVARKANIMAEAVGAMLRCSSIVIFVDPHFGPERARFRRPLQAFLERLVRQRPGEPPNRVEIHTLIDGTGTEEFFRSECQARLPQCVPRGIRIVVRRLRRIAGGDTVHNRYILTDVGGVIFGVGLDDGPDGETDDLNLMGRGQYETRWAQYVESVDGFNHEEEPVGIDGTRN